MSLSIIIKKAKDFVKTAPNDKLKTILNDCLYSYEKEIAWHNQEILSIQDDSNYWKKKLGRAEIKKHSLEVAKHQAKIDALVALIYLYYSSEINNFGLGCNSVEVAE